MKYIRLLFLRIAEWFRPHYKIKFSEDLPSVVTDNKMYIIGTHGHYWLLMFNCPCGCNNPIQLNLLKDASPTWRYRISKTKKISITPSIRRTSGCKSHFYVRNGRIDWT